VDDCARPVRLLRGEPPQKYRREAVARERAWRQLMQTVSL